jgi:phosphoglycerate dehydrogenase-like enzyme
MFTKKELYCFQLKQQKKWQRFDPGMLDSKTVGIIGLGDIGRETARLAKAFGMNVIAIRRSAHKESRAKYVDTLLPPGGLHQLLINSDFVVLSVPLTPATANMIGEAELRLMKPGAYLINIARGGLIDEPALIRALNEKWISGVALDVFAKEPLPADSPLWEMPNVIFSPHIAGDMEDYVLRATKLFCENLRRYLTGKRLINIYDRKRGY